MIGLKRDTVKLLPHQEEWIGIFKETELEFQRLLKGKIQFIEHVGPTAINCIRHYSIRFR